MPLETTCIGAFPKPAGTPIKDWFQVGHGTADYVDEVMAHAGSISPEVDTALDEATRAVVKDQVECGIDVVTDGEVRRENYVHYQCRHLHGFDFDALTVTSPRNGAYTTSVPTVVDAVSSTRSGRLVRDWQVATAAAGTHRVKATLPGPMTIIDTTANRHYAAIDELIADLAQALNDEIRALVTAGCREIQIDEPVFARKPDDALAYGIDALRACVDSVPGDVRTTLHMCCGYPNKLDDHDYPKADPAAYRQLVPALDGIVDAISIEDAHRHNKPELFEMFEDTTLVVGAVTIASSAIESVDQIERRLETVAGRVGVGRLIAAPDCGLGFLGRELAMTKLQRLSEAAQRL